MRQTQKFGTLCMFIVFVGRPCGVAAVQGQLSTRPWARLRQPFQPRCGDVLVHLEVAGRRPAAARSIIRAKPAVVNRPW